MSFLSMSWFNQLTEQNPLSLMHPTKGSVSSFERSASLRHLIDNSLAAIALLLQLVAPDEPNLTRSRRGSQLQARVAIPSQLLAWWCTYNFNQRPSTAGRSLSGGNAQKRERGRKGEGKRANRLLPVDTASQTLGLRTFSRRSITIRYSNSEVWCL